MVASRMARERAAGAWCQPNTRHKVMDIELAEAFAEILDEEWQPVQISFTLEELAKAGDRDGITKLCRQKAEKTFGKLLTEQLVEDLAKAVIKMYERPLEERPPWAQKLDVFITPPDRLYKVGHPNWAQIVKV